MSEQPADLATRRALRRAEHPVSAASARHQGPALGSELVGAAWIVLLVAPLIVLFSHDWFLFTIAGALLAAAVVALLSTALEEGGDAGVAAAPTGASIAAMAGSLVLALVAGGRWWAAPAILIPAGAGWLALQGGLAHDVPRAVPVERGVPASMTLAYCVLVAVVLLPVLAWLLGVV